MPNMGIDNGKLVDWVTLDPEHERPTEYHSPIVVDIVHHLEEHLLDEVIAAVKVQCDIEVDKDELLKALRYDRDQYDKGHLDGLREGLEHSAKMCLVCNRLPVWHGRWVKISPAGTYKCSICGQAVFTNLIDGYAYCCHCGTKMDGGEDNDET